MSFLGDTVVVDMPPTDWKSWLTNIKCILTIKKVGKLILASEWYTTQLQYVKGI